MEDKDSVLYFKSLSWGHLCSIRKASIRGGLEPGYYDTDWWK